MGLFQERRYCLEPNWTEPNNLCIHVVTKMCKLAPNCCVSYLDSFPVFCQQTQYINTNLNFDQCVCNYVCVSSFVRVCLCICMHIVPKSIPGICLWKDRNEPLWTRQDKNAANEGNIQRTNEIHENNLELFLKGRNDLYLFEMCAHQTYTKKLSLFCFSSCKRTICLLLWKRHICQTFAVVLCASKRLSLLTLGSKIIFWTLAVNFEQRDLFTYSLI